MSLSMWILSVTGAIEVGCLAFLLAGFRQFRIDPERKRIRMLRADLEEKKRAKFRSVQTRAF